MSATSADVQPAASVVQKMTLPTLTAMVVGGMVGADGRHRQSGRLVDRPHCSVTIDPSSQRKAST